MIRTFQTGMTIREATETKCFSAQLESAQAARLAEAYREHNPPYAARQQEIASDANKEMYLRLERINGVRRLERLFGVS